MNDRPDKTTDQTQCECGKWTRWRSFDVILEGKDKSPTTWMTIATAPKDGTQLLLLVDWEPLCFVGYWGTAMDSSVHEWRVRWDESSIASGYGDPTHWMPIGALPGGLPLPLHPGNQR